jgi:hypothetical protein
MKMLELSKLNHSFLLLGMPILYNTVLGKIVYHNDSQRYPAGKKKTSIGQFS